MHKTRYDSVEQLELLLEESDDMISTFANASAFLGALLADINWVGFYLLHDGVLYLGPFQGKPACTRIAAGQGVCGAAIAKNSTQLVADVHAFEGHIACDSASNSELVVVLRSEGGEPIGVLDIDSPLIGRFTERDRLEMERAAEIISRKIRKHLNNKRETEET
ncbi:MAG: GAF domain-containing protein [Eubacteriales bacterium]